MEKIRAKQNEIEDAVFADFCRLIHVSNIRSDQRATFVSPTRVSLQSLRTTRIASSRKTCPRTLGIRKSNQSDPNDVGIRTFAKHCGARRTDSKGNDDVGRSVAKMSEKREEVPKGGGEYSFELAGLTDRLV